MDKDPSHNTIEVLIKSHESEMDRLFANNASEVDGLKYQLGRQEKRIDKLELQRIILGMCLAVAVFVLVVDVVIKFS